MLRAASARTLAKHAGASSRCEFVIGDLRDATTRGRAFDLVSLVSVGAAWGDDARTLRALRSLARPGGLILYEGDWSEESGSPLPTLDALSGGR